MVSPATWISCAALALTAACGAAPGPAVTSRDSAGIEIVESTAPVWAGGAPWRIDPEPLLDIGRAEGDEPYLLQSVENAVRLEDGSIVVGDGGSGQLRWFDSTGRFLRAAGRRGGGPGEFGPYSSLHVWRGPDGAILADDNAARRVNVFDSAGASVRTVLLAPPSRGIRPGLLDVLADGRWLVHTWLDPAQRRREGLVEREVLYSLHRPDGSLLVELGVAPGPPAYVAREGRAEIWHGLPFVAGSFAAASGGEVLLCPAGEPELRQHRADGNLRRIVRWRPPRRRSADLIDAYREAELAGTTDTAWRRAYADFLRRPLPLPELVAGYVRMVVDEAGHVWLQRYYLASERERLNDVIAPDGRWLGTVALPPGYWLLQAGADFILAWVRDELEVEHVVLHRLRRSGG